MNLLRHKSENLFFDHIDLNEVCLISEKLQFGGHCDIGLLEPA